MRVQLPGCEICHLCPRPRSQRWLPDLDQIHVYMEKRTRPLRGNILLWANDGVRRLEELNAILDRGASEQPTNQPTCQPFSQLLPHAFPPIPCPWTIRQHDISATNQPFSPLLPLSFTQNSCPRTIRQYGSTIPEPLLWTRLLKKITVSFWL